MTMTKHSEQLPRPAAELERLAEYYDTHDTSTEMDSGDWVEPQPMATTSLRLPADVIDQLKQQAQTSHVRYTTYVRAILERAARGGSPPEWAEITERLDRIERALSGGLPRDDQKSALRTSASDLDGPAAGRSSSNWYRWNRQEDTCNEARPGGSSSTSDGLSCCCRKMSHPGSWRCRSSLRRVPTSPIALSPAKLMAIAMFARCLLGRTGRRPSPARCSLLRGITERMIVETVRSAFPASLPRTCSCPSAVASHLLEERNTIWRKLVVTRDSMIIQNRNEIAAVRENNAKMVALNQRDAQTKWRACWPARSGNLHLSGTAGISIARLAGLVISLAARCEEGDDLADGRFPGAGFGHWQVGLDLVAVTAAVSLFHHIARLGEVGDDAVGAALGDVQAGRDVAQSRARIVCDE
jgi:hypothetical protein